MYRATVNSYFSGAGLMDLGLSNAGLHIQKSLEIDAKCCDTLRQNFNHKIDQSDIRNITVLEQDRADVIVGTYPCTKYSTIADIHGTRTGDDLFLHFFRHIAIAQPEAFVVENVPGMRKFPVVMEAMTKLPNYYVNVFCPLDSSIWLPQTRKRLILIGTKRPFHIWEPAAMNKKVRLKDIIGSEPDMPIPQYVLNRINGKYRDKPIISDPNNSSELAPTCVAHYAKDMGTRMVKDPSHPLGVRPYTVREYARLQGVPDSFKFSGSDHDAYRQIGNGVSCEVAEWIGKELNRYFN